MKMLFRCIPVITNHRKCAKQKMYVTAKQKRDDTSALLSALTLHLNSYYFDVLNFFIRRYLRQYLILYLSQTRQFLSLI